MAYTIHQVNKDGSIGEMLSSGQNRLQVVTALCQLGFITGDKWEHKLPRFGRGVIICHPVISYTVQHVN